MTFSNIFFSWRFKGLPLVTKDMCNATVAGMPLNLCKCNWPITCDLSRNVALLFLFGIKKSKSPLFSVHC